MDGKYWLRIALGMLLVFAVGMVVAQGVKGVQKAVHNGRDLVQGSGPVTLPMLGMGFRFDGQRVGGIKRLQLLRSAPRQVDSAVMTVHLDDAAVLPQFADCRLMLEDLKNINSHSSFRCATDADLTDFNLVPFGHLVLQPGDAEVPLWIPADAARDLRGQGLANADLGDTGNVDVQPGAGGLTIKVNGREVVRLGGDSMGGFLQIRDAKGRPIVDVRGDSSGGSLKVRDSAGQTKLDIDASASAPKAPRPGGN